MFINICVTDLSSASVLTSDQWEKCYFHFNFEQLKEERQVDGTGLLSFSAHVLSVFLSSFLICS